MKAIWTLALGVFLAGCGSAPPILSATDAGNTAQADSLFFKESRYAQQATMTQLKSFKHDEQLNRDNAGKRFKTVGELGYSIGDMQLVDANDVSLTLTTAEGDYTYIHREPFILRSRADAFVAKVGATMKGEATIYFTVKTGNLNGRIHVDAIRRPDGKLVTL